MGGRIVVHPVDAQRVLRVGLSHPGKQNAVSVQMWRELRTLFEGLQAQPMEAAPRAVLLYGEGGHFAAGGDIEEFPKFRFDEETLRHFHEDVVAPGLNAIADCEIPVVAQIQGSCIGGGLEIAACCDVRIAGASSRFGAPIARMGFPMAPGEVELLLRVVPAAVMREVLLEARLLNAGEALARGLVQRVVPDDEVPGEAEATARRIAALSPLSARLNKRTLRQFAQGGPTPQQRRDHFAYAAHPEHREGVTAFLDKRPPKF